MLSLIKKLLASPVFPGDEDKTRQASLLSGVASAIAIFISLVLVGDLLGGRTPGGVQLINALVIALMLLFRALLFRGRVLQTGAWMGVGGFIGITAICFSLGTIRTPSTALYLFLVIMVGAVFDWKGILVAVVASSLAVFGLIAAENAGVLPTPDYSVTITQWIMYTSLFAVSGGLSYFTYQTTNRALVRAVHEIEVRERLEAESRKLTRAVEQSPASIVIADLDGNIEYVNPRFTQVTGYSFDEVVGQNPRILKTEKTLPETHRAMWDSLTAGQEWRGEFTNRKKDGTYYCESATISPITDLNGVTTHYLAVKEDITERKKAEKDLRESEERFRMMFENHKAAMLLLDPDTGQILDGNISAQMFYGYDRASLKTMNIVQINALPNEKVIQGLRSAAQGERNFFVFPHRLASGELRMVEMHSSPVLIQEKVALFSIIHDITDRQRVEDALRESEARWQFALEGAGDGVWDLDCVAGREYYSRQWKAMLGYDEDEISDSPDEWRKRIHPDDRAEVFGSELGAGLDAGVITKEYRLQCKDGSYKWVLDRGKVVQWADDQKPLRIIGTHTDITERKRNDMILQMRVELMEYSSAHTMLELMQQALDKVGELTQSPIGFYHVVDEDQNKIKLQAWSTRTEQEYCQAEGSGMHYDIADAGVWVDCVLQNRPIIHNDYASLPNRKGLPVGHAPLVRELVVPVFRQERVVAILGVGNKPVDYSEKDLAAVFYFADLVWEIAQQKMVDEALALSEARSRALFEQSHDAVFILDLEGRHLAANQRAVEMLGYSTDELKQLSVNDTSAEVEKSNGVLLGLLAGDQVPVYERFFRKKNGEVFPVEVSVELVRDKNGNPYHIQSVMRDISQRKQDEAALLQAHEQLNLRMVEVESLQAELREQALRDPLTGLYNRRYLGDTLEREIVRAGRDKEAVSVIVSDVDHFKVINDTYGHYIGDKALMKIADLMRSHARGSDFVCRYGGEEFLLVMPGATLEAAAKRAEEIRYKCEHMVMEFEGARMQVTMSFGVASFPECGCNAEQVTINADKALYISKNNGRNQVNSWKADAELLPS